MQLASQIQNVYLFIISISGAIAFASLVIGGIRYLVSSGKEENIRGAKSQIVSALVGLLIIFSSWLILNTINPKLLRLPIPPTPAVIPQNPAAAQPGTADVPIFYPKIQVVADDILVYSPMIQQTAQNISDLTIGNKNYMGCSCVLTESTCQCNGGEEGNNAQGKKIGCIAGICYAKTPQEPCPNALLAQDGKPGIKENQKNIIAYQLQLVYYKNRLTSEIADINADIANQNSLLDFYNQNTDQTIQPWIDTQKTKITAEIGLKRDLITQIQALMAVIDQISPFMTTIGALPNQCEAPFTDSTTKFGLKLCAPVCLTGSQYGCHDKLLGCQPKNCTGQNPCPVQDIQQNLQNILKFAPPSSGSGGSNNSGQTLVGAANAVISAIQDINTFETIQI